jgi:hypothetical protein
MSMNRRWACAAALAALVAGSAHAAPPGSIHERIDRAQARIEHGRRTGQLTREEAMRLRGEFQRILDDESRARADGRLDRRERDRLHHELDRLERHISMLKHNDDMRPPRHRY